MKPALKILLIIILNACLFFVLQVIAVLVHFLMFGSGALGEKYTVWVALFFGIIQIVVLMIAHQYKWVVKDWYTLITSILVVTLLFLFFVYLPEATFKGE